MNVHNSTSGCRPAQCSDGVRRSQCRQKGGKVKSFMRKGGEPCHLRRLRRCVVLEFNVPELTRGANIKLNKRLSLRRDAGQIAWPHRRWSTEATAQHFRKTTRYLGRHLLLISKVKSWVTRNTRMKLAKRSARRTKKRLWPNMKRSKVDRVVRSQGASSRSVNPDARRACRFGGVIDWLETHGASNQIPLALSLCGFWRTLQSADAVAAWQLHFCSCFGTAHSYLRPFRAGRRFWVTTPGNILEKQILKPGRITHR